jgi:hypothetical protein
VLAVIATYGDDDSAADAPALIQRMITSECLIAPGGLRVRDTGTGVTVNPGCCCGLEDWREWQDVASGTSPWLGHDPAPWIEHLGQAIRVWPDGEPGEPPVGTTPIEITTTDLPGLIDAASQHFRGFLGLIEPWAAALDLPGARDLASALARHFHITEPFA